MTVLGINISITLRKKLRINVMWRLKFRLNRKSLETLYFSFIRPLLEYADVIWDNCTYYEKLELDKIQEQQNLSLYTLFMTKSDGKVWKKDVENTSFCFFIKCSTIYHLYIFFP